MRIGSIAHNLNVENIKKVDQERKQAEKSSKTGRDASVISNDARRLSETSADANTVRATSDLQPEIRPEKVQEVREKIKNGFYDSEQFIDQLAEKIMKDFGI